MSTQVNPQLHVLPMAKAQAAVQTRTAASSRLLYVDNLRTCLTMLVVIHHLAITYGASGGWFYHERPSTDLAEILLTMFTALNQFYFMGLFFLIAGYFVPGAVDRKGSWKFLKDRLVRLGIPFLLFFLLVSPLLIYVNGIYEGWYSGTLKEFLTGDNIRFDSGPLWFVETLLIFSAVYVLGRALLNRLKPRADKREARPVHKPLTNKHIFAAILVLAPANVAVRLFFPIDTTWHNLQLAFFPQYILLFAAGILAYQQNWLVDVSERIRKTWSKVALIAMGFLPLMMASIVILAPDNVDSNFELVKGGLNALSFTTATFEAVYCVSISILLLSVFRRRFDVQNRLSQLSSRNAYAAYIIHAPVIVLTALVFRSVALDPLMKFVLVAPLAVALTFLVSHYLVRRLPLADRVL